MGKFYHTKDGLSRTLRPPDCHRLCLVLYFVTVLLVWKVSRKEAVGIMQDSAGILRFRNSLDCLSSAAGSE